MPNSQPLPIEDYRWLISDQARPYLESVAAEAEVSPRLATSLRKDLTSTRTHLVLEQVELRRRATTKFHRAAQMFFTRKGFEQATGEQVARFKAIRMRKNAEVVDLCCGIGDDFLAFGDQGPTVGIDRNAIAALLASANAASLGMLQQESRESSSYQSTLVRFGISTPIADRKTGVPFALSFQILHCAYWTRCLKRTQARASNSRRQAKFRIIGSRQPNLSGLIIEESANNWLHGLEI